MTRASRLLLATAILAGSVLITPAASATPVCTNGYMGGPPLELCGGRVFPEASQSVDYVQYLPEPGTGFREYQHGLEYLAQRYPRWVSVFTLSDLFDDPVAVSAGADGVRASDSTDSGDGNDIWVAKLTDHTIPDSEKQGLMFSLSVHGDERGGLEGGVRALEDLAIAAQDGGTITDGIAGYSSTTGKDPEFHTYEVSDVLAEEVVYFVDFNIDGWTDGEKNGFPNIPLHTRENGEGTDLNRQMPTVGWINTGRNPLEEPEMYYGHKFMHEAAAASLGGKLAYGADVHGEGQSRAWVDIMYPAGQFDSVKHRQHMSIAQRTKSIIDDTLFMGYVDELEEATGSDAGEGIEDTDIPVDVDPIAIPVPGAPSTPGVHQTVSPPDNTIPTKPARWGTVWDTLGYTDTGFIGDYLAGELGVTGMDYEIAFNHSDTRAYGRPWGIIFQENYVNATRAIVKTAMAYAMTQNQEFSDFELNTGGGRVGYVYNPDTVSSMDENGPGTLPGPSKNGIGRNGKPVHQRDYEATNMKFFEDESAYAPGGINRISSADVALDSAGLDAFDTIVIADVAAPADSEGRAYDTAAYYANLKAWVERGGNLVLTDRALHILGEFGTIPTEAIRDITVYQPYANVIDFEHPMVEGLRGNARQLSEATLVGYGIGNNASPMTVITRAAFEAAEGHTVATTGNNAGTSDPQTSTSVGELTLGDGIVRIMGGGLPMPTEQLDHRYGLKDYALTYSGLYIMENSLNYDAPNLGNGSDDGSAGLFSLFTLIPLGGLLLRRKK